MTTPSANPRRFSRGSDNLNPDEPVSVYMSLLLLNTSLQDALATVKRYAADYPQARVRPVGVSRDSNGIRLVLEIGMGGVRGALRGDNPETHAGYSLMHCIAKNMFYARPALSAPPTDLERALLGDGPQEDLDLAVSPVSIGQEN